MSNKGDLFGNRYLLENGADPNIQDKSGKTALVHACLEEAGVEILSLLLSSGADPTLEDHSGVSALIYAVNLGNRDVLRVLVDACKAKGKEVIIITTDKLSSGHHVTKQYLNATPPPELQEHLHYTPASCQKSSYEAQLQTPPQASSANASPHPGSPLLDLRDPQCLGSGPGPLTSQPDSPIQHTSPSCIPGVDKRINLQKLHTDQWSKSPSLLLQQNQTSEESAQSAPEVKLPFRFNSLALHGRPPFVSRQHNIDVKDATGLLKALESLSGNENSGRGGKRGFGRKMSYDDSASSLHSASHSNLHQDNLPFPHDPCSVNEDSSDFLRQLNVSSLQNVVHRRKIGMNHYISDSHLPQFSCGDSSSKNTGGSGTLPERHKLVSSRSSTLPGSRESLESSVQRRGAAGLERRGSGALLLDHIAHTRPEYLPPLNPHAPIPDIAVSSSNPSIGNSKKQSNVLTGSKPLIPRAPTFFTDLTPKGSLHTKGIIWRRHSMQSEQIRQLVNFSESFGQ